MNLTFPLTLMFMHSTMIQISEVLQFKDEFSGDIISEFIFLKPKTYPIIFKFSTLIFQGKKN